MLSAAEIKQVNQKLNPELALSLSLDNVTRMESSLLRSGFAPDTDTWKLILFYNGSLEEIQKVISFTFIPLLGNFAILFISERDIPSFLTFPQILYMELSRPIYENALTGIDVSCVPDYNIITGRNVNDTTLTGKGTAVAILDSGVDYTHPDFRNEDGSTRILAYWDQSLPFSYPVDASSTDNNENTNVASDSKNTADTSDADIISIKNPYQLGIIFSEQNLNQLLLSNSSSAAPANILRDLNSFTISSTNTLQDLNLSVSPDDLIPALSPSDDISGHGTHIAGICAGNGRASNGKNQGVAPESSLIVVKLKNETTSVYSDYANLMMAVDFVVRFAASRSLPLSINISYGSNDGSHTGNSLLELFMEQVSLYGKNIISVATGNEGLTKRHASLNIFSDNSTNAVTSFTDQASFQGNNPNLPLTQPAISKSVSFTVAPDERSLYLEIWQSFADNFSYELFSPSGMQGFVFPTTPGIYTYQMTDTIIYLTLNNPTPYQPFQQYFLTFSPRSNSTLLDLPDSSQNPNSVANTNASSDNSYASHISYITPGTWTIRITPLTAKKIVDGRLQFWLPSKEATNSATGFVFPSSDMTFTIPSTATNVISVSGYDSALDTFAPFSGQGFSNNMATKPDLCAPAVNILSTAPGGGYTIQTGTSMAAPFVTGVAALLMQYGIVKGNDPFLYGQKIKAYLWKGARSLPAFSDYPNNKVGWGALCVKNSIPGL